MGSDRARLSDDPSRGYRGVIWQQGRVSLEADGNEAARLAETARRQDMIDAIGPAGTSDDGYEVTASGGGFAIGTGSYHIGGWRVALDAAMPLGGGPDELDTLAPTLADGRYAIALLVTEQEVSAVEDRALLEVALGGPDTTQRTRLMQRAVAIPTGAEDCDGAATTLSDALSAGGATRATASAAIVSTARLRVTVIAPPPSPDPCDPPAHGGYLGADNRLIRVRVTAFDAASGRGRIVWGFDNASILYRASTNDGQILTLASEPIDGDHSPRLGQAIEILRTRTLFDHGDVAAADCGVVTTIAQPYDPDLRRIAIAATLPTGTRGDAAHPLFVRLWEAETDFTRGVQVELGDTGIAVTLTLDAFGGPLVAPPFWCFAARPSTPVLVYPRRYLDAPQPPEGPRQWIAPLAVGAIAGGSATMLDDCRATFVPLIEQDHGCCAVVLDAGMSGQRDLIQEALDDLRGTRGSVALRPGHYRLRRPIRLDASHKGLTLEGCGDGVFLEALDEEDPAFAAGLIVLDDVNEVALRNLQLQLPATPIDRAWSAKLGGLVARDGEAVGSVGVSATGCAQLTITGCQFRFRLKERRAMIAVGLLARGECWGMTLTDNRFLHDIDYVQSIETLRLLFGVMLVPAMALDVRKTNARDFAAARLDALLDDARIEGNAFVGLTVAAMIFARLGYVRVERNRVTGCSAGIYLIEAAIGGLLHREARGTVGLVPVEPIVAAMRFAGTVPGAGKTAGTFVAEELRESIARAASRGDAAPAEFQEARRIDRGEKTEASGLATALGRVAAAIETHFTAFTPRLHVSGNDIDVFGDLPHDRTAGTTRKRKAAAAGTVDTATAGPKAHSGTVMIGLTILLEIRERPVGDVIVSSNRIANARNPALSIAFAQHLVCMGNIVIGDGSDAAGGALTIWTDPELAMIEVVANVVDRQAKIMPGAHPVPPSDDWHFFNRLS